MSKIEIYIHIGTHKTGTSTIQTFLINNKEALNKENIFFLGRFRKQVTKISEDRNYTKEHLTKLETKLKEKLSEISEIRDPSKTATFIISNEKLSGNKRNGYKNAEEVASCLNQLLSIFEEKAKIILYLRRQDDFLESLYAQRIYNGQTYSFDEFLDQWDENSFSWERLVRSYEKVFGREQLIVKRYHKDFLPEPSSIIQSFGKIVNSSVLKNFSGTYSTNRGFSHSSLKLLNLVGPNLQDQELKVFKKLLRRSNPKSVFKNYTLLKPSDRKKIIERYHNGNSWVAENYFPSSNGQLFPEDIIEDRTYVDEIDLEKLATSFTKISLELEEELQEANKRIDELERKKNWPLKFALRVKSLLMG